MGLYDRPYYQEDYPRSPLAGSGRTMTVNLIIVNVVVYAIDVFLLQPSGNGLGDLFAVRSTTFKEPWTWWRFLTYGFLHDPRDAFHLIGNMLGLYFLGQSVEQHYGPKRYLRMYLTSLIFCSLVWGITELVMGSNSSLIGASGAVTTVVMLFALNFPRRTIMFMMFLPMPAWVLGVMIIVFNLFGSAGGSMSETGPRVAYDVHLMGALYGYIFFRTGLGARQLAGSRWQLAAACADPARPSQIESPRSG